MKTNLLKYMAGICFGLLTVSLAFAGDNYKTVKVKAPFPMQPIKIFIYPDKDFPITDHNGEVRRIIQKPLLPLLRHVIKREVDVWLFRLVHG